MSIKETLADTGREIEMMRAGTDAIMSALDKLANAMDAGPGGEPAVLHPNESTILYRMLTEVVGVRHRY